MPIVKAELHSHTSDDPAEHLVGATAESEAGALQEPDLQQWVVLGKRAAEMDLLDRVALEVGAKDLDDGSRGVGWLAPLDRGVHGARHVVQSA